jgi:cytochrome c oxidase cbb3-type subunit III
MKLTNMFSKFFNRKAALIIPVFLLMGISAMAQPKPPSTMSNPLAQALVVIMILLALAIAILANVVNNAAALYREKMRRDRAAGGTGAATAIIGFLMLSPLASLAQEAAAVATAEAPANINGLSAMTFYLMIGVIGVEIVILIALVYQLRFLMGLEKERAMVAAGEEVAAKPKENWWWKLNKSADIAHEQDIDLSHDYDGISELDNKLPPWWTVAFGITILFSIVYLYRYHVSESAPLQIEELQIAIKEGEAEKAAYLAKTSGNVDENTVVMLDAGGIASGKTLFQANCIACHGTAGEGNAVGPNLTDDYWIHGGKINDVFKTIKYGVTEKGMRSWKDDMSPVQMAQLASYIKSLKGSNPPNAKEPQGDKYEEAADGATPADTTAAPAANPTVKL